MQVRTLHFSDFLKLGRMHQADIGLNLPFALVMPDLPLPAALTQHLPVNSSNSSVYICEEHGRPQAFVQARARQRRDEWELLSLGVIGKVQPEMVELSDSAEQEAAPQSAERTAEPDNGPTQAVEVGTGEGDHTVATVQTQAVEVSAPQAEDEADFNLIQVWPEDTELAWLKLLEHLVVDAAEKGVVRLYARLSTESAQYDLFNQTGFHPYTHESLFHLAYNEPIERPVTMEGRLKPQRSRDAWFIQQLYSAVTPSFVQNSEQSTSRSWEIHRGYFPRPSRETGWVMTEDNKATAYIRILSYRNRHLIRVLNLDTRRDALADLLRFALSTFKAGPDTQVYCVVREYQAEQESFLEDLGFSRILGKQAVLVKHTVQYVRSPERQLVRGRESKLELARTTLRPRGAVRLARSVWQRLGGLVTRKVAG